MTTRTDQHWEWEIAGPVTLPRLGAWQRLDERGAAMVLAHPEVPAGTFRPNLVLRIGQSEGGSLATLSTRALIATLQSFDSAHVVSHEEATLGEHPARRQKFTYDQGGQAVCVDRWFCVLGDLSIEITSSFAPDQMIGMESLLHRMVSLAQVAPVRLAPLHATLPEPALDVVASQHLGRPLEDLSRVAAVQPYRSQGPIISDASLEMLLQSADRGRAGVTDRLRRRAELAELSSAGLLSRSGEMNEAGRRLVAPLQGRPFSFTVGAQHAGMATAVQVWVGTADALLVSGPAPAAAPTAPAPAPGQVQVDLVSSAQLPSTLASWLGVGPAWSYVGEHLAITPQAFERRLERGPAGSAPASDPGLVRLWDQPWLAWTVQETGAPVPEHTWLSAGTAGQHLAYINAAGSMELEPFASSAVWSVLARFVLDGQARAGVR